MYAYAETLGDWHEWSMRDWLRRRSFRMTRDDGRDQGYCSRTDNTTDEDLGYCTVRNVEEVLVPRFEKMQHIIGFEIRPVPYL